MKLIPFAGSCTPKDHAFLKESRAESMEEMDTQIDPKKINLKVVVSDR